MTQRKVEDIKEVISRYESGESASNIAKDLGFHVRTINRHLRKNNISAHTDIADRIGMLKQHESEIVKKYQNGKNIYEIAAEYNCTAPSIRGCLVRNGIDRRSKSLAKRKYQVNDYFFDVIDTEEKAYILGFIYADGHNQVSIRTINIELHEKDVDVLKKIRNALTHTGPIAERKDRDMKSISICNKRISEELERKGVIHKKAISIRLPLECVPDHLIRHFLRGYFDGDGSIFVNSNNTWRMSFSSSAPILRDIQLWIFDKLEIKLGLSGKELQTNKRSSVLKLAEFLYSDSTIYMNRKKKLADICIAEITELLSPKLVS